MPPSKKKPTRALKTRKLPPKKKEEEGAEGAAPEKKAAPKKAARRASPPKKEAPEPVEATEAEEPTVDPATVVGSDAWFANQMGPVLAQFDKKYGKGAVMALSGKAGTKALRREYKVVSTGSLALDKATGIGGLPLGRIVELYGAESSGKTSVCLHVIANAQKMGLITAFVDAEHALDVTYAEKLGVNLNQLLINQPDSGEQALRIVDELIDSERVSVIVVDSVAALVPEQELSGEIGDSAPGAQARLMSQALRRISGKALDNEVLVIFINQTRMKIGVQFGCFSYDTQVMLEDGSYERIGKIVNNRMPVQVRSFDPATGEVSSRQVVDWHENGAAESFLKFTTETGANGNGRSVFRATDNHVLFRADRSEVAAGEVRAGDFLAGMATAVFNEHQTVLALSQILGDGSVRSNGPRTSLRVGHGPKQVEYAKWKESVFGELVGWSGPGASGSYHFDLTPSADLTGVKDGPHLIQRVGLPGVAVWCMDDGSFSGSFEKWGHGKFELYVKRWTDEQREAGADALADLGLPRPTVSPKGYLWSGDRTRDLQEKLAPFFHPSMSYKLHPRLREKAGEVSWDNNPNPREVLVPVEVLEIERVEAEPRKRTKFDITVEDNATYFVGGGVGVHNSPSTTSGGKALRFYASLRIEVARIGSIKGSGSQSDQKVANRTKATLRKNKVAPPFTTAEFDIVFGKGIDTYGELLDMGVKLKLLTKAGSWYQYEGSGFAQGRQSATEWLQENPHVERKIREALATLP